MKNGWYLLLFDSFPVAVISWPLLSDCLLSEPMYVYAIPVFFSLTLRNSFSDLTIVLFSRRFYLLYILAYHAIFWGLNISLILGGLTIREVQTLCV